MKLWIFSIVALAILSGRVLAEVRLPSIFGDHMVLQRDAALPIWGFADPGESVTVEFENQKKTTTANRDGEWSVTLDAIHELKSPETALIVAGKNRVTMSDVLMGDVWLCSGQSNMQLQVKAAANGAAEVAAADHPTLRLFQVDHVASATEQKDVGGHWAVCSPKTVAQFSAAGYYFGRDLQTNLKIPIGLIHSSWGGTLAEAWSAPESLKGNPILAPILQQYQDGLKDREPKVAQYRKLYAAWALKELPHDPGNAGLEQKWNDRSFDDASWTRVNAPFNWADLPEIDVVGMVWFRKEVEIPSEWSGKDLAISLGAIGDCDITYFNGQEIGTTWIDVPGASKVMRHYTVPGKLVHAGKNVIAIRAFNTTWGGSISGPARDMLISRISTAKGDRTISLAGEWKTKLEQKLKPNREPAPGPREPVGPDMPAAPSNLFNGMIRPLIPYAIKGVIWYQGESNAGRADQYASLLPAMITGWRKRWHEGDFPFLIVQLPNFSTALKQPVTNEPWPNQREAQAKCARSIPNAGLAVTIDLGEFQIHPLNKQDVGKRLALLAQETVYHEKITGTSPELNGFTVEGSKILCRFDHVGSGLKIKTGLNKLGGFAIAGRDHKFVWADAQIVGDTVVVQSPSVNQPVAVRYLWANNPSATLYNSADLPAGPFRTDIPER